MAGSVEEGARSSGLGQIRQGGRVFRRPRPDVTRRMDENTLSPVRKLWPRATTVVALVDEMFEVI